LISQQREIAITVYNNDLAVVKDIRNLDLKNGMSELKYQEVAAQIDPTSVHFKSLTAPEKVAIIEQNYEYDLVSADKIAEKYLDKDITIILKDKNTFTGQLLSYDGGYFTLKTESGVIKLISRDNIANIDFPKLPEGLITRPTLVWTINNTQSGNHKTEVSYLTSGMSWHAEYVAVAKDNDQKLELNAWVSIDNRSGATYPDAKLKLIAGEVHQVMEAMPMRMGKGYALQAMDAAVPQFEEKSFFEYHLYTLQRRTTIKQNQIKQISLFPSVETKVNKIYVYESSRSQDDVKVNLEFFNSKQNGMGMPLPAGKVRVYKEDPDDASLEYIGEDLIGHTPKDEKIRLFLGNAFDIKAERAMTDKVSTGKESSTETWQIKLRNHKDAAVDIVVVEKLYGFWEIKKATHQYKKKDATTVEFFVNVPKDQEVVLEYMVAFKRK
ncbi:DUF4139 domain-containing protein, partial [candidate division KSB1 bacterium]|nr:DUF4139 domain-containing protein [candidate division KSB1 bacterium]